MGVVQEQLTSRETAGRNRLWSSKDDTTAVLNRVVEMNAKQLQECYVYLKYGKGVVQMRVEGLTQSESYIMFYQMLPFAIREQNAKVIQTPCEQPTSFLSICQELPVPKTQCLPLDKVRQQIQHYIEGARKNMHPADFRHTPIRFIMQEIAAKSPLQSLELSRLVVFALADFITDQLSLIGVDPYVFIQCCYDSEFNCNHFVDLLLCRQQYFEVIQHRRIDCVVVNSLLFADQQAKLARFEQIQKENERFSEYINCRRCKKFMITVRQVHASLGLDEIDKSKATCHNPSCRHVFITR